MLFYLLKRRANSDHIAHRFGLASAPWWCRKSRPEGEYHRCQDSNPPE